METPCSVKRRNNNNIPISKKTDESGSSVTNSSRRTDKIQQKPLIDITNDSPIVGLASGSLLGVETPSSAISSKQRSVIRANKNNNSTTSTPGSGEALLRGQVKTLLQKVEEEAKLSKMMMIPPFKRLQGFLSSSSSPMGLLLAPTPANTPQISDLSGGDNSGLTSVASSPAVEEQQLRISQVLCDISDGKKEEVVEEGSTIESQKSLNRSLLFDFSEKSDVSSEDCYYKGKQTTKIDDDNSSVWSLQVNASARDEEEEEEEEENSYYGQQEDDNFEGGEDKEEEGLMVEELCEAVRRISVNGHKFSGKHTRFVYDSDDEEIVEVAVVEEEEEVNGVRHLKGLPSPKGKHIRFPVAEEEDD